MEKKVTGLGVAILMCISLNALYAQDLPDKIQYDEVLWSVQKRALIAQAMNLTDFEASAFWPVYETYENSRRELSGKYMMIMNDYVEGYPQLTNKESQQMAIRLFRCDTEYDQLYKEYYRKMKIVIGAANAYKFMQLEMHIQNIHSFDSQAKIPFITQMETQILTKKE